MSEQDHHYFATNAFCWGVGATREAAVKECIRRVGAAIVRQQVTNPKLGGVYVWACRVKAPQSTHYGINNFMPQGVEIEAVIEAKIVNLKGHVVLMDN